MEKRPYFHLRRTENLEMQEEFNKLDADIKQGEDSFED